MLEFCDLPYLFVPPQPSRFWMRVSSSFNRFYHFPQTLHRITGVRIEDPHGLRDRLKREGCGRVLFLPNHSRHCDPQVMTEAFRQLGATSCFMAAYELFHRGKLAAWLLPRIGVFSVDREGSDTKALRAAGTVLREGPHALTIFPEGNVYLMNDTVTPFLEGAAFTALRAQKDLDEGRVLAVPVSIKYSLVHDRREAVRRKLEWLGSEAGTGLRPEANLRDELARIGLRLLGTLLERNGYDVVEATPEETGIHVREVPRRIIQGLEESLGIKSSQPDDLVARIRKVRSVIHQARTGGNPLPEGVDPAACARDAILAQRVLTYKPTYIRENPSLDRFAETVEKITEDWTSAMTPSLGWRRAVVRFNEPIDLTAHLPAFARSARDAVSGLTHVIEESVQRGLDEVGAALGTPGTREF